MKRGTEEEVVVRQQGAEEVLGICVGYLNALAHHIAHVAGCLKLGPRGEKMNNNLPY